MVAWTRSWYGHRFTPPRVQPIEYYTSDKDTLGVTVFSLGNFISNQSQQGTEGGICIRVTLTKPRNHPVRYQMEPIKFYMYRPYEEGRRRYYVVPENLADSVIKDFTWRKARVSSRKQIQYWNQPKLLVFSFPVFTYIFIYLYDLKITWRWN